MTTLLYVRAFDKISLVFQNELSQALQKKDPYIIKVMYLVNITKKQLQTQRNDG